MDDEAIVRQSFVTRLRHVGCVCHTAESYQRALDLIAAKPGIEVVILDHGVSGDNTSDFLATLRQRCPGVVVVGSSGRDCREEFSRLGVDRFLRKPWMFSELATLLGGRVHECSSCGIPLPLRLPLEGEAGESWVCASCGARYRAVIDGDAPPDRRANVRPA